MKDDTATELYRRFRPQRFVDVLGQPEAVTVLEKFLRTKTTPHVLLFHGPSGCGKTTLARILARKLGCGDGDFQEVNCGSIESAIDSVRDIERRMGLSPLHGLCRVWLLDEIQSLSRAKFAQQALLKILEDTPSHVYFLLCTTEPEKLLKTVRSRCTEVRVRALPEEELAKLVRATLLTDGTKLSKTVIERLVDLAEGSARKVLQDLGKVLGLPGEDEQLAYLQDPAARKVAFDLARLLVWERSPTWPRAAAIIRGLDEGEDWEGLRRLVLACATKEALKEGAAPPQVKRAVAVLGAFGFDWYTSGKAGLVASTAAVLSQMPK